MANDRNRMDEQYAGPDRERPSDSDEQVRNGTGEDVRGVADEGDEDFDEMDDLEEDEDEGEGF